MNVYHESMLSKKQLKDMIANYNIITTEDIKGMFKGVFSEAVQEIVKSELDTHLVYETHSKENKDNTNRRNATSSKTVRFTEYGEISLSIPRDQ